MQMWRSEQHKKEALEALREHGPTGCAFFGCLVWLGSVAFFAFLLLGLL
jgi:hypothetical protein